MSEQTERLNAALAGRYRIERHLGEGGMASVYLCEDLKHDRKVALKLLKPELAAVLGAERFVVEIKTTAALQHPHILPLFDSGTADGFLFYVMPFIEGETLRDKLNRETQLGVDEAVRIAREVLDALQYAHEHGIVHRDVKPENILLHGGHAMVADFGIALAVSAAAGGRMTETGLSLGTPHYMSPEQATAEKEITARSDVYSLGAVLYEMLTGDPPHTGSSAQQIIMRIITDAPRPVSESRKSVPPNVVAAVARSLEKLPADRFESAKSFSDALANPTFATSATTAAFASGTARGVSRRLFAATAVVAALSLAAAAWLALRPVAAKDVLQLSVALPEGHQLTINTDAGRIAISPDARQLAMVLGTGTGPNGQRLFIRSLDQLNATPIAGTEGAFNPSFSPDGKRIAFVSGAPRAVRVVSTTGGAVTTLTDSLVDPGGLAWGNDGYIYYDGHLEGDGLARIRETGGSPEIATRPDAKTEQYHVYPSPLPDGRGVLFVIARPGLGASQWAIGVFDSRTGKHTVLMNGVAARYVDPGQIVYVTYSGVLMAAPFDLRTLRVTGQPVAILQGLSVRGNYCVDLAIAQNGFLAYTAGTGMGLVTELVWVTRSGVATPVDSEFARQFQGRPVISPDGKTLAVAVGEGLASAIWVKTLDRGPASKLVEKGREPVWSADGKFLYFVSGTSLMRVPADGSTLPVQVFSQGEGFGDLDATRDGKWFVYATLRDLLVRSTAGDSAVSAVGGKSGDYEWPTVSPDGRWLAYSSEEISRMEVEVRPFPDTKVTMRQVSPNEGYVPLWSRDGRELLYLDANMDMISVPIIPGTAFAFGAPVRLFPAGNYSVQMTSFETAPDGKRFLFTRPLGGRDARGDELVVVQNFPVELRAKLRPGK